jgi:hypothetical protein
MCTARFMQPRPYLTFDYSSLPHPPDGDADLVAKIMTDFDQSGRSSLPKVVCFESRTLSALFLSPLERFPPSSCPADYRRGSAHQAWAELRCGDVTGSARDYTVRCRPHGAHWGLRCILLTMPTRNSQATRHVPKDRVGEARVPAGPAHGRGCRGCAPAPTRVKISLHGVRPPGQVCRYHRRGETDESLISGTLLDC